MMVSISKAAEVLGVCKKTLRRWDKEGRLVPCRTAGGHRRYDLDALFEYREDRIYDPATQDATGIAAVYCRVSSHSQKEDLARQKRFLSQKATSDGYTPKVYKDIGSGLNDGRRNFLKLVSDGIKCKFDRVYLTYKDRLARFGTRPIRRMFQLQGIEMIVVHSDPDKDLEERLVEDMIALVTSFSGKLHRMRRGKNNA